MLTLYFRYHFKNISLIHIKKFDSTATYWAGKEESAMLLLPVLLLSYWKLICNAPNTRFSREKPVLLICLLLGETVSKLISGFISSLTSFFYMTLSFTSLLSLQPLPKQLWNLNFSNRRLCSPNPFLPLAGTWTSISPVDWFRPEGCEQGWCLGLGRSWSSLRKGRQEKNGPWLCVILKLQSSMEAGRGVLLVSFFSALEME